MVICSLKGSKGNGLWLVNTNITRSPQSRSAEFCFGVPQWTRACILISASCNLCSSDWRNIYLGTCLASCGQNKLIEKTKQHTNLAILVSNDRRTFDNIFSNAHNTSTEAKANLKGGVFDLVSCPAWLGCKAALATTFPLEAQCGRTYFIRFFVPHWEMHRISWTVLLEHDNQIETTLPQTLQKLR